MQAMISDPTSTETPQLRRFIVNLLQRNDKGVLVRSCEITTNSFRNRTSFAEEVTVDQVFVDTIAQGIQKLLSNLSGETEVIALPSELIEVPGLVLANAQLMATRKSDGSLSLIFRFMVCIGSISHAFLPSIGFEDDLDRRTAATSTQVMTDIAMPLLDLCTAAEAGLIDAGAALGPFGIRLVERAEEIRFHVELLKRYADMQIEKQPARPLASIADSNIVHLRKS